ncbi:hypothetical protein BP6252_12699 [Coleophoma cylindrospora]|uniref:AB hydrolase-1 domain-containing protein n=1 Tax=Coleophoma cylindrospora TaxID=1849047 RepID=A0A3D8QCM4_9HELO|nr:hypothetical protein BP6252_12699 [Coleophoma cylindrospora]
MLSLFSLLAFGLASAAAHQSSNNCVGINAVSPKCSSSESFYKRDVFWVGGEYTAAAIGTLTYGQVYVEKLTPLGGIRQPWPVVLFHGGGSSGAIWLNTPDNRKGFASYFLDKGYQVYVVDQTSVGRATSEDLTDYVMRIGSTSEITEAGFTAPQISDAYPQSQLHTQWPGNGTQGDAVFDAFESNFMPLTSNNTVQELSMRSAGCQLLNLIGPSFLLSHSIGAVHPLLLSDECPDLVVGNVNLEAGNIPFQSYVGNSTSSVGRTAARPYGMTVTNMNFDPPVSNSSDIIQMTVGEDTAAQRSCIIQSNTTANYTIRTLPNVAKVPYVLFTGQASPHITYDWCIPLFLNQAGVSTEWIKLADNGIYGNAHFGFIEKNNQAYFNLVESWISKAARRVGI